jgi:geranylgeranyl diphosphate synthase, type I
MNPPARAARPDAFKLLLAKVKTQLDARLLRLLDQTLEAHSSKGQEIALSLSAARTVCLGGKRLRGALVRVGQECFARPNAAARTLGVESGVAVELLQTYFLVHDDWMDRDDTRRGVPAVHAALAKTFASEHKGAAAAVLAGDYLVAMASQHLTRAARKHERLADLLDCFAEMQLSAVLGQQLDVIGVTRNAELVYELKTGSYTVRGPLQLGALLAGASPKQLKALQRFADPLGVAFQIQDDLLGAFGSPEVTGKPRGNDLLQGKWTWIVQSALDHGNTSERQLLEEVLGKPKARPKQIAAATNALQTSGALARAEARIAELRARAERALQRLDVTPHGRALLAGSISALLDRKH